MMWHFWSLGDSSDSTPCLPPSRSCAFVNNIVELHLVWSFAEWLIRYRLQLMPRYTIESNRSLLSYWLGDWEERISNQQPVTRLLCRTWIVLKLTRSRTRFQCDSLLQLLFLLYAPATTASTRCLIIFNYSYISYLRHIIIIIILLPHKHNGGLTMDCLKMLNWFAVPAVTAEQQWHLIHGRSIGMWRRNTKRNLDDMSWAGGWRVYFNHAFLLQRWSHSGGG